ncbi:MAG: ATP phosphoribosyltransferase regulatory subunit [Deltaproteobacteria bacterium]|nr:ATP phosphoribosyltransferase regulatory subunit [Deltaproteobacteria bacterium]MBP7290764.1 ATP phosphoribosyltransferase regulatory subunit [Nannocystaceae bacterium]
MAESRRSRALLPAAARRRRALVGTLLREFETFGYRPIETPLVESFELLARGLSEADRAQCVRFIEAGSGELVTLRADPTPQIAHMVATTDDDGEPDRVLRWCYAAAVVRQSSDGREPVEQHQLGVELVGDAHPLADVELVALADAAMRAVGLPSFTVDLAHGQLVRAVLKGLQLGPEVFTRVHAALARKHREGVATALVAAGTPASTAAAIASLCERVGSPSRLRQDLAELAPALTQPRVPAMLEQLQAVMDGVLAMGLGEQVVVDLGETRGFEYYSGVRLRVWAAGVHRALVRGGRYDHLLSRYGSDRPATGFAIDLDALEAALAHAGVRDEHGDEGPALVLLCAPGDGDARLRASRRAADARGRGQIAWVEPCRDRGAAEARARREGWHEAYWLDDGGETAIAGSRSHEGDR